MNKLIELAKTSGFEAEIMQQDVIFHKNYSSKEVAAKYFYLWMCELQKWLRDEHKIQLSPYSLNGKWTCKPFLLECRKYMGNNLKLYDTFEEALKETLPEALKLIK